MDLSIGEISKRVGIKVPTIRFYEQRGLLRRPARTQGNQRRYDAQDVARLNFIRNARALGFEMQAIEELLALSAHVNEPCAQVDEIARAHLSTVDNRLRQLTALKDELERMLDACCRHKIYNCKIIQALGEKDD